jgi:hypothetical protein
MEKLPAALVPPPPAMTDEVIGPIVPPWRSKRANRLLAPAIPPDDLPALAFFEGIPTPI